MSSSEIEIIVQEPATVVESSAPQEPNPAMSSVPAVQAIEAGEEGEKEPQVEQEEGEEDVCDCHECRCRRDPSEYYTEGREEYYYNYDAYDEGGWGCDWNESGYYD
jgi:hypothetical protein